ncbi:hypothetical protein QAD02_006161 [Eretmocerus hayati]|uniref:Uncharacterized protein n=1 Tax=Eretmocerus hayati TaxID=131215 RepID=A0ACC2N0G0_9HYME|nr:hypothetical protein QAD02_006161 [Eretmocerus hayati]
MKRIGQDKRRKAARSSLLFHPVNSVGGRYLFGALSHDLFNREVLINPMDDYAELTFSVELVDGGAAVLSGACDNSHTVLLVAWPTPLLLLVMAFWTLSYERLSQKTLGGAERLEDFSSEELSMCPQWCWAARAPTFQSLAPFRKMTASKFRELISMSVERCF